LSARNEERLYEQVQQLLAWIEAETRRGGVGAGLAPTPILTASDQGLQNLAYTLQVGRTAMEERLALQVNSLAELTEKLRRYLQEPQEKGNWYRGQAKRYKEMVALLGDDEEVQETIDKWFQRGKYEKLLSLWANGGTLDWQRLYSVGAGSESHTTIGACPQPMATIPAQLRRISLPTYPFAQERYWMPHPTRSNTETTVLPLAALHPLVQCNVSDLFAQ